MARNLTEIYNESKETQKKYLRLNEFKNSSKMSVIDAFTWVTSACIWTFENLLDVFKVDLAKDFQNRINGTPSYYANALLKFQYGDELEMNDEGTQFFYKNVNATKRIITRVAYTEVEEAGFHDKALVLKVAKGSAGAYERLSEDEIVAARKYLNEISFAGTHTKLVSRKGDILVPRLTVYYDGSVSKKDMQKAVQSSLEKFVADLGFDNVIYMQRVIDAIQLTAHVVDVEIKQETGQGIYIVKFDDDDNPVPATSKTDGLSDYEERIERKIMPNSGYVRQADKEAVKLGIPVWSDTIEFVIEEQ